MLHCNELSTQFTVFYINSYSIIFPWEDINWPFESLGIGTEIRNDIINAIISISIKPMDPKRSRVVT